MGRRTLKDLEALMGPERTAQAKARARKKLWAIFRAEVRKHSKKAVPDESMTVGGLKAVVTALDGKLEIVARFRDRDIIVSR